MMAATNIIDQVGPSPRRDANIHCLDAYMAGGKARILMKVSRV